MLQQLCAVTPNYAAITPNYAAIAAAAWVEDTFSKKCLKRVSRYNDILADILCQSGTLSGILAIHSDMSSGILAGIRSGILATHYDICRAFCLAFCLPGRWVFPHQNYIELPHFRQGTLINHHYPLASWVKGIINPNILRPYHVSGFMTFPSTSLNCLAINPFYFPSEPPK